MQAEGIKGLRYVGPAVQAPARLNLDGALVVMQGGGKYTEGAREGRMFVAANQSAAALTAGFATTYTGLLLSNPPTSRVNLVLQKCGYTLSVVASAATAIGLMTGNNPTTPLTGSITPRPKNVGSGINAVGLVMASATLTGATPVLEQVFAQVGTLAVTGFAVNPSFDIDLDGSMILTPGAYVAFWSAAAITAAFYGYFMWEEVPLQ